MPGVGIEVFEYFCVGFGPQIHVDFGEGAFDGADAGQAPGGGDHLVDEVALDVVGRGEAIEIAKGVPDEDVGIFIGVVKLAHAVFGGLGLAIRGDGSFGFKRGSF